MLRACWTCTYSRLVFRRRLQLYSPRLWRINFVHANARKFQTIRPRDVLLPFVIWLEPGYSNNRLTISCSPARARVIVERGYVWSVASRGTHEAAKKQRESM
jgi:hypothetical protein